MIGSDVTKLPSQTSTIGSTQHKVQDLITKNTYIKWSGIDGKVYGQAKKVDNMQDLYGEEEGTGHFFPVQFDESYSGQELGIKGMTSKETVSLDEDCQLVLRLENMDPDADGVIVISKDEQPVVALNMTDLRLL